MPPTSPTTYNPRENTFIKAPTVSTCPHCGQTMTDKGKPMINAMNNYINEQGVVITLNHDVDTIDIRGVTYYRCDTTDKKTGLIVKSSIMREALYSKGIVTPQVTQQGLGSTPATPIANLTPYPAVQTSGYVQQVASTPPATPTSIPNKLIAAQNNAATA